MATALEYNCLKCKLSFCLTSPHLFYRTLTGEIKIFDHPGPYCEFKKPMGIFGSASEFFCFDCKHVSMQVVKEFEEPVPNLMSYYGQTGLKKIIKPAIRPSCTQCKSNNLFRSHELGYESDSLLKPCMICGEPVSIKHLFTT